MQIDISRLPYKHRFSAASQLMSKGNRLTELTSAPLRPPGERQVKRVLEGLSYYDIALSLMKRMDPNYQTCLNWKCLALISIGQHRQAREWYEELVRIADESEGANQRSATAALALEQIARLADQGDVPLPELDSSDISLFDDPPFCEWAEQVCWLLRDRKFRVVHRTLSAALRERMTLADLQARWTEMVGGRRSEVDIALEAYKLSAQPPGTRHVGWCYFHVTNDEISEAVSMDVYRTPQNAFEIGSLEFGRP